MAARKRVTPLREGRAHIQWVRAYLECLFDARPVHIFEEHKHQLELILERP